MNAIEKEKKQRLGDLEERLAVLREEEAEEAPMLEEGWTKLRALKDEGERA